ncbi:MAG: endonuclease/exonuclease/phosphatase family protein [Flavobacteriales bacterium]
MRSIRPLACLCALFISASLQAQEPRKEYVSALVGFYNVENLYDTIDSPNTDDSEFLPDSPKQWGSERYWRKLDKMGGVIASMGKDLYPQGLAVFGLAEIETRGVVEDLVHTSALKDRGYRVVQEEGPDRRGVDCALVYDPMLFKETGHKSYRLHMADTAYRTRDQLLVSGVLDGDTVHFIVAHWPSRRGGEKSSEPNRKAAAELGRHIIDSLLMRNANARIIYMGDLNDDPVNVSITRYLRASGDMTKAVIDPANGSTATLFDPMAEPFGKGMGTLAWHDAWNLFDQIIVSPALVSGAGGHYKYYGVRIFDEPFLKQKEGPFAGQPSRTFVGDTYQDGYSDHFPVFLILVREAK